MHTNLNRQDTVPIRLQTQTDKSHADMPMNPIRSRADMPANQPYDKTPCRSAYGTDPALAPHCHMTTTTSTALYCHIPSTN